jgi:hypothetical protein
MTLGEYAFTNCPKLETVILSDYLTFISTAAFANDVSLKKVELPKSLVTINQMAFMGCTSLEDITFKGLLNEIGSMAFANTAIKEVLIPAKVSVIGMSPFGLNVSEVKIRCYKDTYAATWARENGYECIDDQTWVQKSGDLDGDGIISVAELNAVMLAVLGKKAVEDFWLATQANRDAESLSTFDAALLRKNLIAEAMDAMKEMNNV